MFKRIIEDFDLKNTFLNGQCFRFDPYKDGYLGIALNKVIFLKKEGNVFYIDGVTENEFDTLFFDYFDLSRDYRAIAASFKSEENLERAIVYGSGMKILRQQPWETLISFIISQNNNIGRIKSIISRLSMAYGTPVEYDNTVFYLFPTKEQLKNVTENDYKSLGLGYRAGYLEKTVKDMLNGKIDLDTLKKEDYFKAKEILLSLHGVGPKVADCILLFGLNHLEAFPVDTWIKKVMEALYLKRSATNKEIWLFAKEAFGEYAGIAQQYLFYYARENKIKGID
ncbi:MAG: 8-oxoguanine DNA glycosylase [Clostridia bacterium]|nr:8-oxoguanine DNA glycosylase [Clostridia bacterium]